jgi:hypothetical protein
MENAGRADVGGGRLRLGGKTTIPSRASLKALTTFSRVTRLVVPLYSCPTGAHRPQVFNAVRHFSYWARSAAVSGGAAGACAAARWCVCGSIAR